MSWPPRPLAPATVIVTRRTTSAGRGRPAIGGDLPGIGRGHARQGTGSAAEASRTQVEAPNGKYLAA